MSTRRGSKRFAGHLAAAAGTVLLAGCGGNEAERSGSFDVSWSPDGRSLLATVIPRPRDCAGGGILCSEYDGDGSRLWVFDTEAGVSRRVAQAGAYGAWSPDGTRIAYTRRTASGDDVGTIAVADADGRNQRDVSSPDAHGPVWSPDGTKLLFRTFDSERRTAELWVVGADGAGSLRLAEVAALRVTGDGGRELLPYAWAPDSRTVALASGASAGLGEPTATLVVIRDDGSGRRQVTERQITASWFSWSPDGSRLAFSSSGLGLHVVRADGDGLRLLVPGDVRSWSWSPDGSRLAFTNWTEGGGAEGTTSVGILGLDDGEVRELHRAGGYPPQPAWSPDGSQIAFAAGGIVVAAVEGTARNRIAEGGDGPVWSPDGSRIAFLRDQVLHVVGADGSGLLPLPPAEQAAGAGL
jgi:TolB protein